MHNVELVFLPFSLTQFQLQDLNHQSQVCYLGSATMLLGAHTRVTLIAIVQSLIKVWKISKFELIPLLSYLLWSKFLLFTCINCLDSECGALSFCHSFSHSSSSRIWTPNLRFIIWAPPLCYRGTHKWHSCQKSYRTQKSFITAEPKQWPVL